MSLWRGTLWALCLTLAWPAYAQVAAPVAHDATVTRVLSNGLRVVARADKRAPLVAIDIRYGVGAAIDPPDAQGLAGGIAYVLRDGESRHLRRGEAERIAQAAGLSVALRDVTFSLDSTHVTRLVSAEGLEIALWMEADRMAFPSGRLGIPRVTDLATPVLGHLDNIARSSFVGPDHPYFIDEPQGSPGTPSMATMTEWVRARYAPANATISVAGDIEPERAVALVEHYFGGIGGGSAPRLPELHPAIDKHDIRVNAPTEGSAIEVAWRTPSYLAPDDPELEVTTRLLEAQLTKTLERDTHATIVRVSHSRLQLSSMLTVFAVVDEERWESEALAGIDEQVRRLAGGDFSDAELVLAKRNALRAAAVMQDSLAARTIWDAEAFAATATPDYASDYLRRLEAITAPAVSAAIVRNLTPATRLVVHIEPKPGAPRGGVVPDEPHRRFRPPALPPPPATDEVVFSHAPGKMQAPSLPPTRPVESSTSSGTRVRVVTRPELPLVRFSVFAPWAAGLPALTTVRAMPQLLAMTLIENEPLESRLAALGVDSEFEGDVAGVGVLVTATRDAVDESLRLVFAALREPRLSKDAANDLRKRLSVLGRWSWPAPALRRRSEQISDVIGPYAAANLDVPTTTPFPRADLQAAVRAAWAQNLTVNFVGAISPEGASVSVENADRASHVKQAHARPGMDWTKTIYNLVQDAHAKQTSLVFACVVPDYIASRAAAASLPASMAGAFFEVRRGAGPRGYGPGPFLHSEATNIVRLDGSTLFYLGYAVPDDPEAVAKSVHGVLSRAEAITHAASGRPDGVSAEAFSTIQRGANEWLLNGFDSTAQELDLLRELGSDGLALFSASPLTFTTLDIGPAVRDCFAPGALHVIGYGQVDQAAAALTEGGYGPVPVFKPL
jgi:predicted Zn-dependent peptidase